MRPATRGAIIATIATSLSLSSCSFFKNLFGGKSEGPTVEGCPDKPEEVSRLAWDMELPESHDIKAGLIASLNINELAGVMTEELNEACGDLAKQLFVDEKALTPEDHHLGADANLACAKADEAFAKLKGIAGGTIEIQAGIPLCQTPMTAAKDCMAACKVIPKKKKERKAMKPQPKPECEGELSGTCDGNCTGQCTIEDDSQCAGTCAGLCEGSCDSLFTGVCRGKCEGTCDGAKSDGECGGTCQGRCLETARGTCGGTCMGSCEGACTVEAAGQCDGICSGECNKPLKEKQCTGTLRLAGEANNECEEACDTALMAQLYCIPPVVKVKVNDFENEEAAGLIERSLSQHLPKILAARALNIEQTRFDAATTRSRAAVDKMKSTLGSEELKITKKQKTCAQDMIEYEMEASAALPVILDAANIARASAN